MYFLGGILSAVVCLLVSSIDLKFLKEKEVIKISINNIKKYYNLLNFILIFGFTRFLIISTTSFMVCFTPVPPFMI